MKRRNLDPRYPDFELVGVGMTGFSPRTTGTGYEKEALPNREEPLSGVTGYFGERASGLLTNTGGTLVCASRTFGPPEHQGGDIRPGWLSLSSPPSHLRSPYHIIDYVYYRHS